MQKKEDFETIFLIFYKIYGEDIKMRSLLLHLFDENLYLDFLITHEAICLFQIFSYLNLSQNKIEHQS